jgi:hypothetical protein
MNTFKRWLPILIGASLVAMLLAGFLVIFPALAQGPGGMMGGYGGMMGGYGPGGMMRNTWAYTNTQSYGYGYGGMMGGYGGMMGGGMMGNSNSPFFTVKPLTMDEVTTAVNTYLTAEIVEKDSGIRAMEVLVDPRSKAVYPEMGPNMMWNLKYGMMSRYGMMGNAPSVDLSAPMPITPDKAIEAAQAYLDTYINNNLQADKMAERFYGYYTLHVNRDGKTVGMLSVNGYTGQVFLHTWHGNLVEMSEE